MANIFKCSRNQLLDLLVYVINNSLIDMNYSNDYEFITYSIDDVQFLMQVDTYQKEFIDIKTFAGRKIGLQIYEYTKEPLQWIIYSDVFDTNKTSIANMTTPRDLALLIDKDATYVHLDTLPEMYYNKIYLLLHDTETNMAKVYSLRSFTQGVDAITDLEFSLNTSGFTDIKRTPMSLTFDNLQLSIMSGELLKNYVSAQDIINSLLYKDILNLRAEELNVRIINSLQKALV